MSQKLFASRGGRIVLAGGGLATFGVGLLLGNLVLQPTVKPTHANDLNSAGGTVQPNPDRFSVLASSYDSKIDATEKTLGVDKLRGELLQRAHGTTLEIATGTYRNAGLYPSTVSRLVLTDASADMCQQAANKVEKAGESFDTVTVVCDAHDLSRFPNDYFDTVVDTFGLCSFHDPNLALSEMKRVVSPQGRVLLLEHGRAESGYSWIHRLVNLYLDKKADAHAKEWGCVFNRSIPTLVQDAGLTIETIDVHHNSTMYSIVAKKESS